MPKKIIIVFALLLSALICCTSFLMNLATHKRNYNDQITSKVQQYLAQQKIILHRLGGKLIPLVKQENIADIAQNLNAYEEIIFVLARQGLAVPVSVHLVSLDAPQQIVGSFGISTPTALAPDEAYYSQVVEEPLELAISQIYIKNEMPNYSMLNLGVGIEDNSGQYYGHLDVKLAVTALHDYIAHDHALRSKLFNFSFAANNSLKPEITINSAACIIAGFNYVVLRLLILAIAVLIAIAAYKIYTKISRQIKVLQKNEKQIQLLNNRLHNLQMFIETQNKYGKLLKNVTEQNQAIELRQLLNDVKAVNSEFAMERGVSLIFPEYNSDNLRFHGNRLRLMQILSGMLHDIIWQMASMGQIELKVKLNDNQHGLQKLVFSFTDNGFYNNLQDRNYELSVADVRCKGWTNICSLIEQENGILEHVHTAYTGNSISLSIQPKIVNNVVNLESYYQDA